LQSATAPPAKVASLSEKDYRWVPQLCPICELKPTQFLGYRGGEAHRNRLGVRCEIWRCGRCGLNFPDPMPLPKQGLDQHYKVEPAEYFAMHDPDEKRVRGKMLLREAERLLGRTGTLLDVGAGRGEILRAARELGWDVTGLEPSASFAHEAAAYSGCRILQSTLEESDFGEASFDVVILSAILEHLYDPDATIEAVSRVLKPGGAVFLEVPNEHGIFYRAGDFYHRVRRSGWTLHLSPTFPPYHVFGFGKQSLKMLLEKHQLKPRIVRIREGDKNMAPNGRGVRGALVYLAVSAVFYMGHIGSLGTNIEAWAIRR
jgi:SAM-dependent methyltransferase